MGVYRELARRLAAGEAVALATVVGSRGSTPRKPGTKMLVYTDGQLEGTVGGGCGEAAVWRAALDVVRDGGARLVEVDLLDDPVLEAEAVCGGVMDVWVDRWSPDDAPLAVAAAADCPVAVVSVVNSDGAVSVGARLVVTAGGVTAGGVDASGMDPGGVDAAVETDGRWADTAAAGWAVAEARAALAAGAARLARSGGLSIFIDVENPAPILLIAGAGHIGRALAQMATLAGFRVAVLDDRPEYANPRHFATAEWVLAEDFAAGLRAVPLNENTYVVIVTRGHRHDYFVLTEVIDKPVAYLGMIGSRRRVATVFQLLREAGVDDALLERVHAPIGLRIGAETPAEIAVSILAEVITVRRAAAGGASARVPASRRAAGGAGAVRSVSLYRRGG